MTSFAKNGFQDTHKYVCTGCFILVLAFSIFGWGLHSKLSLYETSHMSQAKMPVAKLLSEQERPATDQAQHIEMTPVPLHPIAFYIAVASGYVPVRRLGLKHDELFVRPIAFSFDGPSLLRPPPSPVA